MVYIQSDSERKLPHHFDVACALYGAKDTVQDYRLTSFEEVQSGKFDNLIKTNLFVGSVEFMREVFTRVNKVPQPIINTDRHYNKLTLYEVRHKIAGGDKLFVKPFQQKLFTGLVVDQYFISSLREFPDDLEVMVYDVIDNIESEWRLYVMNGKIQDARNYSGDFTVSPDYATAEGKVKTLRSQLPIAFTMDIGVSGKWSFVVEFNDMYAIGNYGMDNSLYIRMLKERYFEIMRA